MITCPAPKIRNTARALLLLMEYGEAKSLPMPFTAAVHGYTDVVDLNFHNRFEVDAWAALIGGERNLVATHYEVRASIFEIPVRLVCASDSPS